MDSALDSIKPSNSIADTWLGTWGVHTDPAIVLPKDLQATFRWIHHEIQMLFERGVKECAFLDADPFYLNACFSGTMGALGTEWMRDEQLSPIQERIDRTKEFFRKVFRPDS